MTMLPLLLYLVAGGAYGFFFVRRDHLVGKLATSSLAAAALIHTFVIGMRTVEVGQLPFVGTAAVISAFVWLLAVAYLYTEVTTDERAMGVFIVPLLVGLQTISTLSDGAINPADRERVFPQEVVRQEPPHGLSGGSPRSGRC